MGWLRFFTFRLVYFKTIAQDKATTVRLYFVLHVFFSIKTYVVVLITSALRRCCDEYP